MKKYLLPALFALVIVVLIGAGKVWKRVAPPVLTFTEECLADGNMWHTMTPLRNGVQLEGEAQPGCMTANGLHQFADASEYRAAKNPGTSSATLDSDIANAGERSQLIFTITQDDGNPPELFLEHDRYLHVIIVSRDMRHFAHVHPEEQVGFSKDAISRGVFSLAHVFPAPGEYIVAIDYANKLQHESRQFRVTVPGEAASDTAVYRSPQTKEGYSVNLTHQLALEGRTTTLRFTVEKNGSPVNNLTPYLGAAMHVAVVKNDLSEFRHAHGEVHSPGAVQPTQQQAHIHTPPPSAFGPIIEAHVTFPTKGVYTVFAEFADANRRVVRAPFTVEVQ